MKYAIKIDAMGRFPEIEIDKHQFETIYHAREILSNGLAMEEKYEILISNYLDFEKEILCNTAKTMVRTISEYEEFFQVRINFNIRLVNLLTATRLYKDSLHRHVRAIIPEVENIKETIKEMFTQEFEDNPEYRFVDELRDHVQHRGVPVHWTSHHSFRDQSDGKNNLIFSLELATEKKYLEEDPEFKKKVLEELPERIDLKNATRVYIESMSRVHSAARKLIQKALNDSRNIIENFRNEYQKIYPKKIIGLSAFCFDGNKAVDRRPLLLVWDDIRIKLTNSNSELKNLRRRYVVGCSKDS